MTAPRILLFIALQAACSTPIVVAQINPQRPATDFAIFSAGDVTLDSYSTTLGDVYAGGDINIEFGFGIQELDYNRGDMYAYRDIETHGGLSDINGSIYANRNILFDSDFGVEVTGNATYGAGVSSNAGDVVAGSVTQQADSVPSIPLPPVRQFSIGTEDYVEVDGQSTVVLQPGAYRNVSLTSNTDRLHLYSGDYYMRRLDTWISTELHLHLDDGPINVYIQNDAFFESGLTVYLDGFVVDSIGVDPPANIDLAELITFEVHGDFTIDSGFLNSFVGTVFAPQGNVGVDTQGFYGSILSGQDVSGNLYVQHYPSQRLTDALYDFNRDGVVDAADYTVWRDNLGASGLAPYAPGDANGDGAVTQDDYNLWRSSYAGAGSAAPANVPEPTRLLLAAAAGLPLVRRR